MKKFFIVVITEEYKNVLLSSEFYSCLTEKESDSIIEEEERKAETQGFTWIKMMEPEILDPPENCIEKGMCGWSTIKWVYVKGDEIKKFISYAQEFEDPDW